MSKPVIVLKCFECTYFDWLHVEIGLHDAYSHTVYAKSPGQAKSLFIRELEIEHPDIFLKLKTRRRKSQDYVQQEPHPLASQLSEKQIEKMKHAVGICVSVPFERWFYRNRYVVPNDEDFNALIPIGMALQTSSDSTLSYYYLTQLGKEVISSLGYTTLEWYENKTNQYERS